LKLTLNERFLRSCEHLSHEEQGKLLRALVQLRAAISDPHRHSGLGLRKLSPRLWELRVGISMRAVFALEQSNALFLFLGTHNEVRRFLRDFRQP
jgi:mRNA-degrading endonuclease RelE of RelBE toxin-antitoxin system